MWVLMQQWLAQYHNRQNLVPLHKTVIYVIYHFNLMGVVSTLIVQEALKSLKILKNIPLTKSGDHTAHQPYWSCTYKDSLTNV